MNMKRLVFFCIILAGLLHGCNQPEQTDHENHDLVKKEMPQVQNRGAFELESLLKPTNQFVISGIPVTAAQKKIRKS